MEVFGNDLILGNFRLSDYGMVLASFDYNGESEDELGFKTTTVEEFVGHNPVPMYLGDKYSEKLRPKVTFVKDPTMWSGDKVNLTEKECRNILRTLTGIRGYQWMKVLHDEDEDDIWFRSKICNVAYKRIAGAVAGIILEMECDSCFAWSTETDVSLNFKADKSIRIHSNTDDLHNYIYPVVTITPAVDCDIQLTNVTDNYMSEIKNVKANETITIDSN